MLHHGRAPVARRPIPLDLERHPLLMKTKPTNQSTCTPTHRHSLVTALPHSEALRGQRSSLVTRQAPCHAASSRKRGSLLLGLFCSLLLSMIASTANAAVITSNGTGGGAWSNPATWTGGTVPAAGDDVIIADGDTVTIDTNVPASGSLSS